MAITRTARGTASSKTSGTTLTIPSFTVPVGHSLLVGAAYANGALAPSSVVHAGRALQRRIQQDNVVQGYHCSMWLKGEYRNEQTGTCVLTWDSAIVERAAWATSYDLIQSRDDVSGFADTVTTTTPDTGSTGALIIAGLFVAGVEYEIVSVGTTNFVAIGASSNTVGELFVATGIGLGTGTAREALSSSSGLAVCCFGANGPEGDTKDGAQIRDNGSLTAATIGQSVGTTGGGAATNVTATETYLQLTTRHFSRGVLGGSTTSRRWASCILVLQERAGVPFNRTAISPSDVLEVEEIVASAGGNVDDVYFGFNEDTGLWEAHEIAAPGTVRAILDPNTGWGAP